MYGFVPAETCNRLGVVSPLPTVISAPVGFPDSDPLKAFTAPPADWPDVAIRPAGGIPTLHLNGRPWFGYAANRPYLGNHLEAFRHLAGAGLRHFHFDTTCTEDLYHPELAFWKGPDHFDPSVQDEFFRQLTAICPEAWFTLRLGVYAPEWWLAANPAEVQIYADGSRERELQRAGVRQVPSLASPKWRKGACAALEAYVDWLRSSGWSRRVVSVFLTSGITWEWALLGTDGLPDYSPPALRYFREYLQRRYGTEAALRSAWNRDVSFATAEIPDATRRLREYGSSGVRSHPEDQDIIDHQQSVSSMNADFLLALAGTLKRATKRQVPVGTFYGYTLTAREQNQFTGTFGAGGFFGGHHEFGRVLRSKDVDFIASPFNYADRSLGTGLLYEHVALASVFKNGKAFWDENDLWSFTNPPTPGALPEVMSIGYTPTRRETILMYRRAWASAIVRGKHQWLTELTGWIGNFGENFSDPEFLREIGSWNQAAEKMVTRDRTPKAQVAYVLDEFSIAYLSADHKDFLHRVYHGTVRWAQLGTPFDLILLDDLLEHPNDYRLVIPAGIVRPEARQKLQSWREKSGTAVMGDLSPAWYPPEDRAELLAAYQSAGVHRYLPTGTVWANASMLLVHVDAAGDHPLDFGTPVRGREFFSGHPFETTDGLLSWNFAEKDVALFLIEQ